MLGKSIRGLVIGALIPGIFAYQAHQEVKRLRTAAVNEVTSIEKVVQSLQEIDRNMQTCVRATRIWENGGEYEMVEDRLARNVSTYQEARKNIDTELEARSVELKGVLDESYQERIEKLTQKLKDQATMVFGYFALQNLLTGSP